MAQIVKTMINIDGTILKRFRRFELHQAINDHHRFALTVDAETIDGKENFLFENSKNLIGTYLAIVSELVGEDNNRLEFEGVITNISRSRYGGHSGEITLSGYSATILLDTAPQYKSYTNQNISDIANDILAKYPQNRMNPSIKPWNKFPYGFVIQYRETEFQFLKRLCAMHGEWLYFERDSLKIGKQPSGDPLRLTFGSNISEFNLGMSLHGANHQSVAYDFQNSKVYTSTPAGIEQKAGLDELGQVAYQASKKVFNATPKTWNNTYLNNQSALDDYVNTRAAMQSSGMVKFHGISNHPGVKLGEKVDVRGSNIYSFAKEDYGKYIVTSIKHTILENNSYSNNFEAVPDTIKVPPVEPPQALNYEIQSATVTDNHDKQGLGRVRVRFHWMDKGERTPWIRVSTPHAGGGKGAFFIPEIGEEVMVGFEESSGDVKPFVIGTVYHQQANNSFSNAGNDVKAIQTRSGNKIIMNDAAGSMHLSDKGGADKGADLLFDGAGNAIGHAKKDYTTIIGEKNTVAVGESHTTGVGENGESLFTMDKQGNIAFTGKNSFKITIGSSVLEMKKDGTITINGETITTTTSKGTTVNAGKTFIASADANHISGITKLDGGDVFVN